MIYIRHYDGTIGEYGHLQKGGIKVKLGQRVEPGQPLGLSGQSGWVRGPHLHFMVFRAKSARERESFPLRFRAEEGDALEAEEGRIYTAVGPAP
jgi:murein DD-endopeptidase MepM/ murein hydrolase activator NlpD